MYHFPEICLLIQVLGESCVRLIPETQSEMTDNTVTSPAEEQTTTHHTRLPESSILTTLQAFDPVLEHMAFVPEPLECTTQVYVQDITQTSVKARLGPLVLSI